MPSLSTLFILSATFLDLVSSEAMFGQPSCEGWSGRPSYSDCILALSHFKNTVTTTRGYDLGESIEFRSRWTIPKHQELPSEVLTPEFNTFISDDVSGPMDGNMCVVVFSLSYPQVEPTDVSFVSTYAELAAVALTVADHCIHGIPPPVGGPSGGTCSLTSYDPTEAGIKIISTVYQNHGFDKEQSRTAVQSSKYLGERLLGGNPFIEGGPDPLGRTEAEVSDKPLNEQSLYQEGTSTRPADSAYCNAKIESSCWPGFKCAAVRLASGVKSVLWGLEMRRAADFVGSCIIEGSGG